MIKFFLSHYCFTPQYISYFANMKSRDDKISTLSTSGFFGLLNLSREISSLKFYIQYYEGSPEGLKLFPSLNDSWANLTEDHIQH